MPGHPLEVLSTHGKDLKRWRELVDAIPIDKKDIYLLPDYSVLYESEFGEPTFLFRYGDETGSVMMVASKRHLQDLPFYDRSIRSTFPEYCDISSPYGYFGPIVNTNDQGEEGSLFASFRVAMHEYCLANGIVAEFLRLNPITQNHTLFGQDTKLRQKSTTVLIDLKQSESELWMDMKNTRRSEVRKAKSNGVTILHSDLREEHLREFHRIYTLSMKRLNALPLYFFSLDFLNDLVSRLSSHTALFFAMWQGKAISAQLFFHCGQYVDYYLSGSDSDYWNLNGNVIGIYTAILWAKQQGYQFMHLGGGHGAEDDSLYRFKSKFSRGRSPYYMYQKIHDSEGYARICELKREYDNANLQHGQERIRIDPVLVDYFPYYRG